MTRTVPTETFGYNLPFFDAVMRTIRLLLGDQLNSNHSWFKTKDKEVIYLMAEMRQEATYVTHHIQKLLAFFTAMRRFADHLDSQGHRVYYLKIADPENPQDLEKIIHTVIKKFQAGKFEYQLPDEYRLDEELKAICSTLSIPWQVADTEHFYTGRNDLSEFFKGKKQLLMESFYRMMRKKHHILMDADGSPLGGKWNYDKSNRKSWKGEPQIPPGPDFTIAISDLLKEIDQAGINYLGTANDTDFNWPLDRTEALEQLEHFTEHLLSKFGDYQDAMHTEAVFLFHSKLSFPLNTKILGPGEVIDRVIEAYKKHPEKIDISQVEGFTRQILGWREYMRGIYWKEMPQYKKKNFFNNHNPLPEFYWTGHTQMNCLQHSIRGSLKYAYAHHIQRLMITGNFALLIQSDPDATDQWYLGIYIDALEWVEITNTRGMSQFADGGLLATKPYISSANYINKMSNYCRSCKYNPKQRTGDNACPFNALYWNFLNEKRTLLKDNPRMGMMYRLLDKIDPEELKAIKDRSNKIMEDPDKF